VDLRLTSLTSRGSGLELGPLVPALASFPNKTAWSGYIRRALAPLTPSDAEFIRRRFEAVGVSYDTAAASYAEFAPALRVEEPRL
jgi:hypothetical protein